MNPGSKIQTERTPEGNINILGAFLFKFKSSDWDTDEESDILTDH